VLIHPAHVVKQLTDGAVATAGYLELDHYEMPGFVDAEDVDATVIDGIRYAATVLLLMQAKARFDDREIARKEVPKVGFDRKLLLSVFRLGLSFLCLYGTPTSEKVVGSGGGTSSAASRRYAQ
jgi:hypothetical protein